MATISRATIILSGRDGPWRGVAWRGAVEDKNLKLGPKSKVKFTL